VSAFLITGNFSRGKLRPMQEARMNKAHAVENYVNYKGHFLRVRSKIIVLEHSNLSA
jgi:hypothetical protein